ncbi:hypothetical protein J2P12_02250 [Candidatus Bathyarchaeota archaeon]|nr:hypothetical protein [Candidatus Bathyarchaeota archaeon]
MLYSNLLHLKTLLMIITAAGGTVAGGLVANSYANPNKDPGSFLISLNPSSMWIVEDATSTSTITVTSLQGFTGTVGLSLYFPGTPLTASISPASVTVPKASTTTATLSVTAPSLDGTYSIVVIGLYTNHGKTTYSSTMLTVNVVSSQDFTLTSSPNIIATTNGATNTTMITVTSANGYTGNVSLTVTTPFGFIGVTGGENPLRIVAGGAASSTLEITTSTNTAQGNYTITVTGTDGTRSHTTAITLQVLDPIPPAVIVESLVLNSYHFNNATMLTLSLQNTGNGTITLVSYVIRDSSGDTWSQPNYSGPTINMNANGSAVIYVGSSCHGCIFTGITGLFSQFVQGQTYTVTVTTSRNNQFTFTIVD